MVVCVCVCWCVSSRYSYYLLLTCQKRSPRRVETMNPYLLSSHQSTAKVPVMIMGPRCNGE